MIACWHMILTCLLLCSIGINGNRVRRYRRHSSDKPLNPLNKKSMQRNPEMIDAQELPLIQKENRQDIPSDKQTARQFYPYRFQYGYGSVQGINSPYAGSGVGLYQYGYGEYGQHGQGSQQYAAYYNNRIPGTLNFYPGFNSVGSPNSNNFRPVGTNYPGNYFWSNGQKQTVNTMSIFFSLWISSLIYRSV